MKEISAHELARMNTASLVGGYMDVQRTRIAFCLRLSAHERGDTRLGEPEVFGDAEKKLAAIEAQMEKALKELAHSQPLSRWAMSHRGVSHITAAFLLHYFDVSLANTAGALWSLAGLLPPKETSRKWEERKTRRADGEDICVRPHIPHLKSVCWQMGESFKRLSKKPDCFYGQLYRQFKEQEVQKNDSGLLAASASDRLESKLASRDKVSPKQRKLWESGKLEKIGIDRRASRRVQKIFLSHYHQVGREMLGLPICKPWVIAHGGHVHYIPPPNWPADYGQPVLRAG